MNSSSDTEPGGNDSLWLRAFYMLISAAAFSISETILYLLAIVSLIYRVIKGESNQHMVNFGGSLGRYVQQITNYLTFNSDKAPFPFDTWPGNQRLMDDSGEPTAEDHPTNLD